MVLSAAVAGAIGLAPVVLVSAPAYAIAPTTYAITTNSSLANPIVETTTVTGTGLTQVTTKAKAVVTLTLNQPAESEMTVPMKFGNSEDDGDTAVGGTTASTIKDYDPLVVTDDDPVVVGNDFIVIPAGEYSGTATYTIYDDKLDEEQVQFFTVKPDLAAWADDALDPLNSAVAKGKVYIADDDDQPTLTVEDAAAVDEDAVGAKSVFPVRLTAPSEKAIKVDYTTVNGVTSGDNYGATAPSDYTTTKGTLTIPSKAGTAFIEVPIAHDAEADPIEASPEKFGLNLSNAVNATAGKTMSATGSINDAEAAPSAVVTYGVAEYTNAVPPVLKSQGDQIAAGKTVLTPEKDSGETKYDLTVTLSSVSTIPVRLNYEFTAPDNYAATNGKDYKGAAGSITIPAGSKTGKIPVTVMGDTLYEPGDPMGDPGEFFNVALTSPNGSVDSGSLGALNAVPFLIADDEDPADKPTFSVGNVEVKEGNSGQTTAKFPITLSAPVDQDISFSATTDNATFTGSGSNDANPGDGDVNAFSTSNIVIPAGSTVGYIEIGVNGDTTYEKNEGVDFVVSLTDDPNPLVASAAASGETHTGRFTIANDDAAPTLKFNEASAVEGGQVRIGGTIVGVAQDTYTLGFKVGPTTTASGINAGEVPATAGTDFETPEIATFTVPAGQAAGAVTIGNPGDTRVTTNLANVYLNSDDIDEPTEYFTITATETTKLGVAASTGTFKITDDPADMPPAVSLRDETIKEHEGSVDVHVDAKWLPSNAATSTTQTIEIPWWTVDGSAKAGQDYTYSKGTLKLAPGTMSGMVNVKIIDDKLKEGNETFDVKFGTPITPGVVVEKGTGTVTIYSDDAASPVTPSISAASVIDGPGAVTITGKAGAGQTVELWGAPVTAAKPKLAFLTSAKADGSGNYKFSRTISSGYRFATQSQMVNSKEITVKVGQDPAFTATSGSKGKVTLKVTADPKLAKAAVVIQKYTGGKWVNTAWKGVTNSSGVWTATASATAGSKWTLRASVAGNAATGVNAGYSATKKVTVKK